MSIGNGHLGIILIVRWPNGNLHGPSSLPLQHSAVHAAQELRELFPGHGWNTPQVTLLRISRSSNGLLRIDPASKCSPAGVGSRLAKAVA